MAQTFSLVTKTYRGDLHAFAKLCESIDHLMPDVVHHVVIDRADEAIFAKFASSSRKLMVAEGLLPEFLPLNALGRRIWYRAPFHLVRGWIFQQLAKVKAISLLADDAAVLVDSDVVFLRPLEGRHIFAEGRVKLYHWPGVPSGPAHQSGKWHTAARRALGLDGKGYTGADYISTVIAWSPAVVRAMLTRIEQSTGRLWHDALLGNFRFSECVLYGVFCENVEGSHKAMISPTRETLCHWNWPYNLEHPAGIDAFVDGFRADKVAALLQSNLGLPAQLRDATYQRLRALVDQPANAPSGL